MSVVILRVSPRPLDRLMGELLQNDSTVQCRRSASRAMRYRFFTSHKFHVLSSKMSLYAFSFSVVDLVMRSENWNDAWIVIALVRLLACLIVIHQR